MTVNGERAEPTKRTKISTGFFFLFHYGLFHFGYLIFITILIFGEGKMHPDPVFVRNAALGFLGNELYTFIYRKLNDEKRSPQLFALMFIPYLRIIPMHIMIILGIWISIASGHPATGWQFTIFLVLKIFADLAMHYVLRKNDPPSPIPGVNP